MNLNTLRVLLQQNKVDLILCYFMPIFMNLHDVSFHFSFHCNEYILNLKFIEENKT